MSRSRTQTSEGTVQKRPWEVGLKGRISTGYERDGTYLPSDTREDKEQGRGQMRRTAQLAGLATRGAAARHASVRRIVASAASRPTLLTQVSAPAASLSRSRRALLGNCLPAAGRRGLSGAAGGQEAEVLGKLRGVMDPDLSMDIVECGFVKDMKIDEGKVSFMLELTTPACPVKEEFKKDSARLVGELPWVEDVTVTISSRKRSVKASAEGGDMQRNKGCPGLKDVQHIIAVSSGKGGVGKSTVAVNLAYSIARLGGKVGIIDADIAGPSLPTMVVPANARISLSKNNDAMIGPLEHEGVKLMSYGYTAKATKDGAAVMRGPMASNTMHQLIAYTDWGHLDYLIIDMPPGTSDIHLTLGQEVTMDGAVIVTTPQRLSFVDVVKGIDMFDSLKVPIIGLVQNMAYFNCECGKKHMPFGPGHGKKLIELYGIPVSASLPIQQDISEHGDSGTPFVTALEGSAVAQVYSDLASGVVQQLSKLSSEATATPLVEFDVPSGQMVVTPASGPAWRMTPKSLRDACRCAGCQQGVNSKRQMAVEGDITPVDMSPKGRYALNIDWSDGHSSIYTYKQLVSHEPLIQ